MTVILALFLYKYPILCSVLFFTWVLWYLSYETTIQLYIVFTVELTLFLITAYKSFLNCCKTVYLVKDTRFVPNRIENGLVSK